jgi:hypothetical protein
VCIRQHHRLRAQSGRALTSWAAAGCWLTPAFSRTALLLPPPSTSATHTLDCRNAQVQATSRSILRQCIVLTSVGVTNAARLGVARIPAFTPTHPRAVTIATRSSSTGKAMQLLLVHS